MIKASLFPRYKFIAPPFALATHRHAKSNTKKEIIQERVASYMKVGNNCSKRLRQAI